MTIIMSEVIKHFWIVFFNKILKCNDEEKQCKLNEITIMFDAHTCTRTLPIWLPLAMNLNAFSTSPRGNTVVCSGRTSPDWIPARRSWDTTCQSELSPSNKESSRIPWKLMFFRNTDMPREIHELCQFIMSFSFCSKFTLLFIINQH